MLTIEKLNEYGANTKEGLARCMGNETLYLRLVTSLTAQPDFDRMREQIADHDLASAFESAHAMKGVLANLSITPLYEKVCEITELLRSREETDYQPLLEEIDTLRKTLKELVEN
ncbi:MAG: Hpt domain-containing protein [Clostridiales bacterium]|nr:Hpt domain-containing protein [Clostridiales bacterium]